MSGIPEAPTFRPTEDEWANPMEYMRSIYKEGSKYGIIKIIPPDGWNPDFAIDTEVSALLFSLISINFTDRVLLAVSFSYSEARAEYL